MKNRVERNPHESNKERVLTGLDVEKNLSFDFILTTTYPSNKKEK